MFIFILVKAKRFISKRNEQAFFKMISMFKKVSWAIWITVSLLLIATIISNLEITSRIVNRVLIFVFIVGLIEILTIRKSWTRIKRLLGATAIFAMFLIFKFYLDWRGDWKTQTIMYQHKRLSSRTIESQLQNKGALGYNRRTVDRMKLFPFVSWTKQLTHENLEAVDPLIWDSVDIYVNELELKGG
jgi:hypothetical protein